MAEIVAPTVSRGCIHDMVLLYIDIKEKYADRSSAEKAQILDEGLRDMARRYASFPDVMDFVSKTLGDLI